MPGIPRCRVLTRYYCSPCEVDQQPTCPPPEPDTHAEVLGASGLLGGLSWVPARSPGPSWRAAGHSPEGAEGGWHRATHNCTFATVRSRACMPGQSLIKKAKVRAADHSVPTLSAGLRGPADDARHEARGVRSSAPLTATAYPTRRRRRGRPAPRHGAGATQRSRRPGRPRTQQATPP